MAFLNQCTQEEKQAIASSGGKAMAVRQKQQALQYKAQYNQAPNLCLQCEKPILSPPHQKLADTKAKKFCNRSCAARYHNRLREVYRVASTPKLCKKCRKNYIPKEAKTGSCTACHKAHPSKSELLSLQTKQSLFDNASNYTSARNTLQRHALRVLKQSGAIKECVICGYSNCIHTCHIQSVKSFENNALVCEINVLDNLVFLCPNHHWEFDNGHLDIQKVRKHQKEKENG